MLSNELLSEILEIEVTTVRDDLKSTPNRLYYETSDADTHRAFSPSIPFMTYFDLMYLGKQWAYSKYSAIIYSGIVMGGGCATLHFRGREMCGLMNGEKKEFDYGSEYYAVFMALEWLWEHRNDK